VREDIRKRDNNTCQWCGNSGTDISLHVHHLRPIEFGGDKYNESNLVTLCNRCHGWAHKAITFTD
jgi:5-methylcytosine-specific restriction endonuclease McrA